MRRYDAVVVGSGPNGLTAAATLAREGWSVLVIEAADTLGGGTRTTELTLPGFRHDVCSAIHPLGYLSPALKDLPLDRHGLEWVHAPVSVAHPLDDGEAVRLVRSLEETAQGMGRDAKAYERLIRPFLRDPDALIGDVLSVPSFPRAPLTMARFGWYGLRSARRLADGLFDGERAKALFAGCAAHAILPLEMMGTAAVGMIFAVSGHLVDWPLAKGGSSAITQSLASYLRGLGGEIRTGFRIGSLGDLPPARVYLLDLSPRQLSSIAGDSLPSSYHRRLSRYRYGPGVFKLDWALDGPIPWTADACRDASTVHVGGTLAEIAESEAITWRGGHADRPFVLVAQQSDFDPTRAPEGRRTGYAYCHVPNGSSVDMTERVEDQIERFAPGFRDRILARHRMTAADLERYNEANVGGAITGGAATLTQLFTRPVARLDPYSTPNPSIYLCSASTPPGGGVHGMCGFRAAKRVLRRYRSS